MVSRFPNEAVEAFVASLDEREKRVLQGLKQQLGDDTPHDDVALIRFLRARKHHLHRAHKMLQKSEEALSELCLDTLLETYDPPEVVRRYYPQTFFGVDREGCPISHEALGITDAPGLMKCAPLDELLLFKIHTSALSMKLLELRTVATGEVHHQISVIFDLEGLSYRHLHRPFLNLVTAMSDMFESNFPESLRRLFVVNPPRVFPIAFNIVKPFLHEATRQKFIVLGCDKRQNFKELSKYIDPKWIPQRYGGPVPDEDAGLAFTAESVSKEHHLSVADIMAGAAKVEVARRTPSRHPVHVPCSGACIDFWINTSGSITMSLVRDDGAICMAARSVDCSLTPQHYRYVCAEAGQYHIQLEHSARGWSSTRTVQVKVFVEETPMASHAEDVVRRWIKLHMPEHEHSLLPHVPSSSNLHAKALPSSASASSLSGGGGGGGGASALSDARDSGLRLAGFEEEDDDDDDDEGDSDDAVGAENAGTGLDPTDRYLEEEHNRIMFLLHSMLQNPLSHQRTPV